MCRYQYFVSPAPTSFRALTSRTEARSPSQSPAYNRTELSHLSANPSVSPVAADTTHYNDYNEVLSQIGDHNDINSFFDRYRDRLSKSKHPREAVSNQYGWGLAKG
eukprot:169684_1